MSEQQVVVVTGASAGIGAATAKELAKRGARLVLAARRKPELESVARALGDALAVPTDVTKRADVERLRDEALGAFGHVDVWVNNAGRGITRSVLDLTDEDFDEMMAVNVKSALYGMQAIMPHFIDRERGHLINVSSFLGRVPIATHRSAYNAAKAALNALTANARVDVGSKHPNIYVSLVMPGLVTTDFARNAMWSTDAQAPQWAARAPGGGGMTPQKPEDVAAAIADLIEHPKAEVYTNAASPGMAQRYFSDVEGFEALVRGVR